MRFRVRFLASLGVTATLSWLLLREIDVAELGRTVRGADARLVTAFMVLATVGLFLRALRYRVLLLGRAPFLPLVLVTAARNFLVDLLPARVGSLSYVVLLNQRVGVPLEPVVSSFVLGFVYDLLAMALLISMALSLEFGRFEGASTLAVLLAIFAAGSVAAFTLLAPGLETAARLLGRFPAVADKVGRTAIEVRAVGSGGRIAFLLAISFAIRLVKFGGHWLLLLAVLAGRGIGADSLPFWRVFLGIAGAELSATLPIHGIAGFGTYETAWALGFTALGLDRETAILSGFATHLLSQLYDYSTGILALALVFVLPGGPPKSAPS